MEPADEVPGFSRVRASEIPGQSEDLVDRIYRFRDGLALVREGEILDWIENPTWIS